LIAFGFIKVATASDYVGMWKTINILDPNLRDLDGNIEIRFDAGL
jgi:hypothetical protein